MTGPQSSDLQRYGERLNRAMAELGRVAVAEISPGASAAEIAACEEALRAPLPPEYRAMLQTVNGFAFRVYSAKYAGPEYMPIYLFEVAGTSRAVSLTSDLAEAIDELTQGSDTVLQDEDAAVVRRSAVISVDVFPIVLPLFASSTIPSGAVLRLDKESLFEPEFALQIAASLDEYIERSLEAMLQEGNSVYW